MLNVDFRKLDIYSQKFKEQGYVLIENLLDASLVQKWHQALQNKPDHHWNQIIKNSNIEKDFQVVEEQEQIFLNHNQALKDYSKGLFCFSFKRINKPIEKDDIVEEIIVCLSSISFRNALSKIVQREVKQVSVFYINRFDKGDFLTTHNDGGSSIGIVINLTKNWNPNFGGITFMIDQESGNIRDAIVPKLGRVLVFDIQKNNQPHFVSMVTSDSSIKRLAIVVRYG